LPCRQGEMRANIPLMHVFSLSFCSEMRSCAAKSLLAVTLFGLASARPAEELTKEQFNEKGSQREHRAVKIFSGYANVSLFMTIMAL